MAILFRDYELVAGSDLFDADYYVKSNPAIAALNVDPLLHYLEVGAELSLNPSAGFDSAYYIEQCRLRGETPNNPLVHYITSGAARGLKPHRALAEDEDPDTGPDTARVVLHIDRITLLRVADDAVRLVVEGWAIAAEAVAQISAAVQDVEVGKAVIGQPRPDVAHLYPHYPMAGTCGFTLVADAPDRGTKVLDVSVALLLASGQLHRQDFQVDVDTPPAVEEQKPAQRIDSAPRPIRVEVDEARIDQRCLTVSGWAVCTVGIVGVDVFVDDERLGSADFGRVREDVALARREYPRARNSGFAFQADIARFSPGEHAVRVKVLAEGDIRREVRVAVVIPELTAGAEESVLEFHCDQLRLSTSGIVALAGWMLCGTVIKSIEVAVDGVPVGVAKLGLERADVGAAYPQFAHAHNAGFSVHQYLGYPIEAGEHLVVLTVRDSADGVRGVPLPVRAIEAEPAQAPVTIEAPASSSDTAEISLSIDSPPLKNGAAITPVTSSLAVNGWALARAGIQEISIAIDGTRVSTAQHGIRRADVASAFPDRPDAMQSGFATLIPHWVLTKGTHSVTIRVRDKGEHHASVQFSIEVEDIPEGDGPWSLRRKVSQAEVDLQMKVLAGLDWRPHFLMIMAVDGTQASLTEAKRTVENLADQVYAHWSLHIVSRGKGPSKVWQRELLALSEAVASRVKFAAAKAGNLLQSLFRSRHGDANGALVMKLAPGDELGCDALLEFALASGLERDCSLFYSDERCFNPVTETDSAYFKPGWSPDLLMSTNYLGRPWCARPEVFAAAALTWQEWLELGDYDAVLRATEVATQVHHVPKVLCQRAAPFLDTAAVERQALSRALKRRKLRGDIRQGCCTGFYRVKPAKTDHGLVSIIIPTRATRGLIKVCLDSLREMTAYRNFEIICIENIPKDQREWKDWLRENAKHVIETDEPFNWSRYNNLCAAKASGRFLLFLNDDIEVLEPDWLDVLLHNAARPEVGLVGPQLLYPDRSVQHAGLALTNVIGRARHLFRHGREDDPGYFGLALAQRNVIAVTGACMLMRREVFDRLGGFDEAFDVINNDLDFCLRSWRAGLLNVYSPNTKLIHHEMISRAELGDAFDHESFVSTWRDLFVQGDPYLNRHISRETDDCVPDREPVAPLCTGHPLFARESIRKILVFKVDHIGDCITAVPAIRKLKSVFPEAKITVVSGSATKLVWSMEPAVEDIVEFNFFAARSQLGKAEVTGKYLAELGDRLRPLRFDLAIDLRKSPDTRHLLQQSGARYLAGFDYQGQFTWLDVSLQWEGDPGLLAKRQYVGDDLVNLVDAVASSCDRDRTMLRRKIGPLTSLTGADAIGLFDKQLVCIHAGAGNVLKTWPSSSFSDLVNLLVDREGVQVAMIGGPAEVALSDEVIVGVRDKGAIRNLAGKLPLNEIPDLMLRASLFIGNDSGPKHIAAALGVPTVGIHSANIDPREWGPMGPHAIAICRQTSCSPCYISNAVDCHRNIACIRGIGAGEVYELCRKMLALHRLTGEAQTAND